MYNRILVPIDGSATASHAFDEALKLAHETGAELQALYVVDTPPPSYDAAGGVYYPDIRDALLKEGAHLSADAVERMKREGVKGSPRVVEVDLTGDDVAHRILQSSVEFNADLVVMGTHGRRGWRRLVLGSVAEHFMRVANRPVLLIPGRDAEARAEQVGTKTETPKAPS
ncbi:UspA domain-containing protein [Caballeronia arationis]|jgi:nucleotide-binding universal stress UspA family protein|uniref:Nucleotide-binding universal stress protein, UspA family n=1 Tax=Caballeronia arationis TaxID=1777142 RepID=A0A7Z7N3D9_9BURK|nr:universal stress protein [Caballeronia arationis]SAL04221.1 UspA domain-containing protein [Caballeronia arationis]SOE67148.1 Nucleotide-binding universal stress protein, UspA family [Caballeronia arationis]